MLLKMYVVLAYIVKESLPLIEYTLVINVILL